MIIKVLDSDGGASKTELCADFPDLPECAPEKETPIWIYFLIAALTICVCFFAYCGYKQYIGKLLERNAKEEKEVEINEFVRDFEDGGGLGLQENINPLAGGNQQTRVGPSVDEFGDTSGFNYDEGNGDLVGEFGHRKEFKPNENRFHTKL